MITDLFLQNLPDSAQRLDAIFHAFNDLLFILDSDGTILDYKAGDPSHLYTTPENFLGRKMQNILPPEASGKFEDVLSRIGDGSKPNTLEYFFHTPFGTCWYESRLVSLS
ncbi:MAG: PAS domain-containing protein, partial [Anaerolineales bacterium]|nr:PAS domain-containing protein [Anaerolineales bacterium]